MAQRLKLNTCHLYPDLMDTYGDKGNIITLVKRCEWRDIEVNVTTVSIGEKLLLAPRSPALRSEVGDFDLYFFGGGQDKAQEIVGKDLQKKAKGLKKAVEDGAVLLSICGGYQLLQNYFKTLDGTEIKGIGLFDAHTKGSTQRMIGNLQIDMNPVLQLSFPSSSLSFPRKRESSSRFRIKSKTVSLSNLFGMTEGLNQLIGFENHSGKTYLGKNLQPLGSVIKGFGNNGEDKTEGAIYKNAFGCYLHGSLLPKNPHFADYLISKALEHRYGKSANRRKLEPLDDSIEWQAHQSATRRSQNPT